MNSNVNWIFMHVLSFTVVIAGHTEFIGISVQTVHQGKSVNISCNYKPSNDTERFTVDLEINNKSCSVMNNIKSWTYQSCQDNIRFIWISKTVEMLFEVSNLQINDTGIYKCVVIRTIPPPSVPLGEERTFVQVIGKFILTTIRNHSDMSVDII